MDKKKLIDRLNEGLAMEHASHIQYLNQAAITTGLSAESVITRLKEIASDEAQHAEQIRTRIAALGGVPTNAVAPIHVDRDVKKALTRNLKDERDTVTFYRDLLAQIPHDEVILYEAIEHILEDSQEHVEELERLVG